MRSEFFSSQWDAAAMSQSLSETLRALVHRAQRPEQEAAAALHTQAFSTTQLQEAAEELCNAGKFREAIPVAIQYFMQAAKDPRAAFLLATCLQRTGHDALALPILGYSTMMEGGDMSPGTLFVAGECFASLDRVEDAATAYDATVEASRAGAEHAHIFELATQRGDSLRSRR